MPGIVPVMRENISKVYPESSKKGEMVNVTSHGQHQYNMYVQWYKSSQLFVFSTLKVPLYESLMRQDTYPCLSYFTTKWSCNREEAPSPLCEWSTFMQFHKIKFWCNMWWPMQNLLFSQWGWGTKALQWNTNCLLNSSEWVLHLQKGRLIKIFCLSIPLMS